MRATKSEQANLKVPIGGPSNATPRATIGEPLSPPRSVRQESFSVAWLKPTTIVESTVKPVRPPSAQNSSTFGESNSTQTQIQPSQDSRTFPGGPRGTRSPTDEIYESMKSKDVHASDTRELLLMKKRLRMTDMCSTPDEMVQFDRTTVDGTGEMIGFPDAYRKRELHVNEDFSPNKPSGHLTDSARVSIAETTPRFDKSKDEEHTPLLQCLIVKAKNPWTDDSVEAVIVFDHLRKSSVISKELVRTLRLPAASTPTADFETFTGYNTCIDLFTPEGVRITIEQLATGRLPKQVRTVLVDEKILAALRRNRVRLDVIYAQPYLLVGADELLRLQYRHGPRLQNGLFSVHTLLGVALGGSLATDAIPSKAYTFWSSIAPSTDDAENSRHGPSSTPSQRTSPFSRPSPWLQNRPAYRLAHPADDTAVHHTTSHEYRPAHSAGGNSVDGTCEYLESSATTTSTSGRQSSSPQGLGVQPWSQQKQPHQNPLDAKLPLLPTSTSIYVEVEEVSMAHSAVRPPRPVQEPLCSTEALTERCTPPPPAHGDLIRAALYDAGSTTTRKTRLRYRLPEFARHMLGIYAAPEPVPAVTLLCTFETTFLRLLRAELEAQLANLPSLRLPLPLIIIRHQDAIHHPATPQFCAVLLSSACSAILSGFPRSTQQPPSSVLRTFGGAGSQSDFLRRLRSLRGLPAHAREVSEQQPPDSAHPRPPARNAHTADAQRSQQQPTPQSLTSWPADPTPARLPASLSLHNSGRVRIDPRPADATQRPASAINHSSTQRLPKPAACTFPA
ncbi:hypothetical protein AAVH_31800 [Aphelenchoides avenae]|nr:hypothetical protein AAVH_31800 [Aphelenchus avenae]